MKMADQYRKQGRDEVINLIPKSWLHPIFKKYLDKKQRTFTSLDIENIFLELHEEITALTENDEEKEVSPTPTKFYAEKYTDAHYDEIYK